MTGNGALFFEFKKSSWNFRGFKNTFFFSCYFLMRNHVGFFPSGRNEKSFERFWVSPDDKHLVFTGHDGTLILLSNKTKQWVANLKMNGSARSVAFTPDSQRLLSTGGRFKERIMRRSVFLEPFSDIVQQR